MEPMNWIAVGLATAAASGVFALLWRGRLPVWGYGLQLIPAAMLGHALARIGADTLAAKPWLYAMQAGGLALAFVLPAVWMLGLRSGAARGELARDSAAFVLAYLAMGVVFWGLS